ncbi:hypothetical protein [Arthrobacter sp. TMN-37]
MEVLAWMPYLHGISIYAMMWDSMYMSTATCFIAMPLTTSEEAAKRYGDPRHFIHVLEQLFVPAVEAAGYHAIVPIMKGSDMIQAEIIKNLERADLVLCDVSDQNPNVFFELGIRTALDRPVALVSDGLTGLPFDTNMINTHFYDASIASWIIDEQRNSLAKHVKHAGEGQDGKNSMWSYFGLTQRAEQTLPTTDPIAARMDLLMAKLDNLGLPSIGNQAASEKLAPWPQNEVVRVLDEIQVASDRTGVVIKVLPMDGISFQVTMLSGGQSEIRAFSQALEGIADEYEVRIIAFYPEGELVIFRPR